mmetsp:Transcript_4569/g.6935  ORF Transcript_4569/g.6935 Transcript_4569/m.6935 type:complete len:221 (+) Transcript_4569:241-903(+)
MGMHSYMTTARVDGEGVSFDPIFVLSHVSFGQRCVVLGGSWIGANATVCAETLIPQDYVLENGGTTFGRGSLTFCSTMAHTERVRQTQQSSRQIAVAAKSGKGVTLLQSQSEGSEEHTANGISRRCRQRDVLDVRVRDADFAGIHSTCHRRIVRCIVLGCNPGYSESQFSTCHSDITIVVHHGVVYLDDHSEVVAIVRGWLYCWDFQLLFLQVSVLAPPC